MTKTMTISLAALMLSMLGCDDGSGPVDKRIDCIQICNEAAACVGGDDFDKQECKEECNEEAGDTAVDRCEDCLMDQDSCSENLSCADECSGVLAAVVFN